MLRNPNRVENKIPVIEVMSNPLFNMALIFSSPAPAMIGVESRKENRAADSLSRFLQRAAVIVAPDLETPGIIARA